MLFLNQWAKAKTGFSSSSLENKSAFFLFLLYLFFTISQFGIHFWPEFAFIDGVRSDYLSPILYFSDLIFIALFLVKFKDLSRSFQSIAAKAIITITALLLIRCFFQDSILLGAYVLLRIIQAVYIAWLASSFFSERRYYKSLSFTIAISLLVVSILTFMQWIHHGSIGGLWYLMGERTFNGSTPGIANASLLGNLILRPYATFPHPNVLGGFIVIFLFYLIVFLRDQLVSKKELVFFLVIILLSICSLFLTMSRSAVGAAGAIIMMLAIQNREKIGVKIMLISILALLGGVVVNPVLASRFMYFSSEDSALSTRITLFHDAVTLLKSHLIFGVGLGEFLPALQRELSPKFSMLQPVHNSVQLFITELGLLGIAVVVLGWIYGVKTYFKSWMLRREKVLVLVAIIIIGSLDHYFYSLQQGRVLLGLVLGFLLVKMPSSPSVK